MRKTMLLFDIDGTLLLTGGAGRIAFERAFEELLGIRGAWGDVVPDGKTDPLIIEEIARRTLRRPLGGREYKRLVARYLRHFKREIRRAPRFRVLAGVRGLLRALAKRDEVILGIATGNFEDAAWQKLSRGGLRRFFRFGGFGSDHRERVEILKRAVRRGSALAGWRPSAFSVTVIGDAPPDIRAAKDLGARSVAVATGRGSAADLARYRPDHILPDFSDREHVLRVLIPRETSFCYNKSNVGKTAGAKP